MTTTTTMKAVHPFEESGLGKAPFMYVGAIDQPSTSAGTVVVGSYKGVQIETTAGGTCDHCGKAIINMFRIVSSDGKYSKVGCDCLKKVDFIAKAKLKSDLKAKADAKADARIAKAKEILRSEAVRANLASKPHYAEWAQAKGLTMLDCVEWLLSNGGRSGKTDAAKMIERAAEETKAAS